MVVERNYLRSLIPTSKHSLKEAQALVDLGYPAVAPVLSEMFEWIQDYNWPVAKILAPFLSSIGPHCRDQIAFVLRSNDSMWKYWVLNTVVETMSPEAILEIKPILLEARQNLSPEDIQDEVGISLDGILKNVEEL